MGKAIHANLQDPEFQQRFISDLQLLEKKHGYFVLEMSIGDALALIGLLQLALRHPGNNGSPAKVGRRIANEMIEKMAETETIRIGLGAGNNPVYDVPRKST